MRTASPDLLAAASRVAAASEVEWADVEVSVAAGDTVVAVDPSEAVMEDVEVALEVATVDLLPVVTTLALLPALLSLRPILSLTLLLPGANAAKPSMFET